MPASIDLSGLLSGSPAGLQDIIKQLQAAQTSANEANEKRYQDILGLYGNLGQAGMTRIGQQEQQAQAKSTQDLTTRGLGNTTVTGAMSRGIASDAELSRQQLQEGVAMQKAGVMERRTDQGPDMGMYASLIAGAAKQPEGKTTITQWSPATRAAFGSGSGSGAGSSGSGGGGGGLPTGAGSSGFGGGGGTPSTGGAGVAYGPSSPSSGGGGLPMGAGLSGMSGVTPAELTPAENAADIQAYLKSVAPGQAVGPLSTGGSGFEMGMANSLGLPVGTATPKKGRTYEEYRKTAGKNAVSAGYFASTGMGTW